jgi:hypothetical protein
LRVDPGERQPDDEAGDLLQLAYPIERAEHGGNSTDVSHERPDDVGGALVVTALATVTGPASGVTHRPVASAVAGLPVPRIPIRMPSR